MSFNPPDLKYEIKDTLFCLGVEYEYTRHNIDKGHVWSFFLPETKTDLDVYGPKFIRFDRKVYRSMYDVKQALIEKFRDRI